MNRRIIFLVISLSSLIISTGFAEEVETIVNADDINRLSESMNLAYSQFMQKSFEARLGYTYKNKFLNQQDRENLKEIAEETNKALQAILSGQYKLKKQLEDYQDDDWQQRFGKTGLWRKLTKDIYVTESAKHQIDYYYALTQQKAEKHKLLKQTLNYLQFIQGDSYAQLLKAKILIEMSETNEDYKKTAVNLFDGLMPRSDIPQSLAFRISIERIRYFGEIEGSRLQRLPDELASTPCSDDVELVLLLAFAQIRQGDYQSLEKTLELFPDIEDFLGTVILLDWANNTDPENVLLAELAAKAIWASDDEYLSLLNNLLGRKEYRTSLILYVTATKVSQTQPGKAINLLIEASKLQSKRLNLKAKQIAEQAARLSYNTTEKTADNCQVFEEAFENYFTIATGDIDTELEYLYACGLKNCGQAEKAKETLEKIAARPKSYWQKLAQLEMDILKSKKYLRSGKLGESVKYMLRVIDSNSCEFADEAAALVSEVVNKIDYYSEITKQAQQLSEFVYRYRNDGESALWFLELSILSSKNSPELEELLEKVQKTNAENIGLLRCKARLLASKGQYEQAASQWAKIAAMRKNESTADDNRSELWWRAKYYELYCWSKRPNAKNKEISHTIDVLNNSFAEIPEFWQEKLNDLNK